MGQVLVVEDNEETQFLIRQTLGEQVQVTCVSKAQEAVELTQQKKFDLILLDVMLPDLNGFQLCAQLRADEKTRGIPILFLTGKTDIVDKETGFSLGAEDYIAKPFNSRELKARVMSRIRKIAEQKGSEEWFVQGALKLNISAMKAYWIENNSEKDLILTPNEFKLLLRLMKNTDRILSREQLLGGVWGEDVHITDRTVDKHICSLRKKLGPLAGLLKTISGVGYTFTANSK